jgi:hypothetical protein
MLAAGVLVLSAACSLISPSAPIMKGGCAARATPNTPSEGLVGADCALHGSLRVLEVLTDLTRSCMSVPGTWEDWVEPSAGTRFCLGPQDVDRALFAAPGDCLTDVDEIGDPRRTDCMSAAARHQVNTRLVGEPWSRPGSCEDLETTHTYEWTLTEYTVGPGDTYQDSTRTLLFCLSSPPSSPGRSPDTARTGDCLRRAGGDTSFVVADCAAPDATHRVIRRVDTVFIDPQLDCRDQYAHDATLTLALEQSGTGTTAVGHYLCLAPR